MSVAKVIIDDTTIVDMTDATASASELLLTGYTAYGADGSKMTGTASGSGWTTEGIATNTEPNGAITLSDITSVGAYAFYNKSGITSVTSSSVTSLAERAFRMCSGLTSVNMSNLETIGQYGFSSTGLSVLNLPNLTTIGQYGFDSCTSLTSFNQPKVHSIASYGFQYCTALEYAVVRGDNGASTHGDGITGGYVFYRCTGLLGVDLKYKYKPSSTTIAQHSFNGCSSLNTLILREAVIYSLSSTSPFAGTPFASGGSGGTIYIPKSLYDHLGDGTALDYQSATNWSTYHNYGTITWAQIEGSTYETHYVDGTLIPTT